MRDERPRSGPAGDGRRPVPALDAVVDDVAAAMTAGEPSPALGPRIRARVEQLPAARPRWLPAAAATAAAAAIVAGITIALPFVRNADRQVRTAEPDARSSTAPPAALAAPPPGTGTSPGALTAAADTAAPPIEPRTAAGPERRRAVAQRIARDGPPPALTPPSPIVMEPLIVAPLETEGAGAIDLLDVPMPLQAERLSVQPLSIE